MTQSETIRVEAIATAIHDTLVADGWTTPECDGESRDNGNGIYYRGFSKEGYATITQGYALADPDAWSSYVTSITLECDGKLIRCTDYATPKKLRAFLVRADKLQDIAKAKAERDDVKKAEANKQSDYIAEYVKQNCEHTWEDFEVVSQEYSRLKEAMLVKVVRLNEEHGFEGRNKMVWVETAYEPETYMRRIDYLEKKMAKEFMVEVYRREMNIEGVERFQEVLAGVMLIFTGAEGEALRCIYKNASMMAIAINEASNGGYKAYEAEGVA
tara:strand:- start:2974 stop:3786 length:813 start_codon:yes stop_codon:yes gene_type:complete